MMNGGDRLRRRKSLQERLGLVCCGSTWVTGASTMSIHGGDDDNDDDNLVDPVDQLTDHVIRRLPDSISDPDCVFPSPRMNLADALEAERQSRSTAEDGSWLTPPPPPAENIINENEGENIRLALTRRMVDNNNNSSRTTPARVSLMRLLEETTEDEVEVVGGGDLVCCVCMGRKKGAAFIPCGHTFCRVCSRELWVNRGCCPLCNRSILQILDIF